MINFKEQNGLLFKMLDKPVPLTPDAEMPCLVRLIQDDSPMGKHNKDLHGFDPERLTPKICTEVIDVNDLSDPNRGIAYCDGFMAIQYYRYELIGTLVTEGSAEWALYQMMQGNRVTKAHLEYTYWHYDARPHLQCISEYNCGTLQIMVLPEIWLTTAEPTDWKIYTEPEQPKPLLADAQVGDLCKHRNGDWSQIIDTNGTYIPEQPIRTTLKDTKGINRNFCLSGSHFIIQFGGEYDIVHTEPLAPEGSKDWAWKMMLLGEKICHKKSPSIMYCKHASEIMREVRYNCVDYMSIDEWLNGADKNCWQIYREPKEEPPKEPDNLYLNIKPSNPADWCFDKKNLLVLVNDNFKGIVGENVTQEQVGEIAKLLTEPAPKFVVVPIAISGTVRQAYNEDGTIDDEQFQLLPNGSWDGTEMFISFDALDNETRELVESLLKAQEQNNG